MSISSKQSSRKSSLADPNYTTLGSVRGDGSNFTQSKTNGAYVYSVTDNQGVTINKNYIEPVDAVTNNSEYSTYMEPVQTHSQKEKKAKNIEDLYAKVNKSSPILGKGYKKSSDSVRISKLMLTSENKKSKTAKQRGRYSEHETVMHENDDVYTSNQSIIRKDGKSKTVSFKDNDNSSIATSDRISNDSGIHDDDEVRYVSVIEMEENIEKERNHNIERNRPPSISLPENLPDTPQARNSFT